MQLHSRKELNDIAGTLVSVVLTLFTQLDTSVSTRATIAITCDTSGDTEIRLDTLVPAKLIPEALVLLLLILN